MALNLAVEFSYHDRPEVPVRLRHDDTWIDSWAMVDTGAAISLFDAELGRALALTDHERRLSVRGISGAVRQLAASRLDVVVLPEQLQLHASLIVGFVPGLGKTTGNLLRRDFLELVDFGLGHQDRLLYLGRCASRRRR